jgi:hypothetical protein
MPLILLRGIFCWNSIETKQAQSSRKEKRSEFAKKPTTQPDCGNALQKPLQQ